MQTKNQDHADVISEQRLWTAVIARAIEEWVSGPLRASRDAETYLFNGGSDFEMVCHSAGLDSQALRDKLLRLQKAGKGPSSVPVTIGFSVRRDAQVVVSSGWRAA